LQEFPRERSAVADALTYCDATTSPTDYHPDCRASLSHRRANHSGLRALLRWQQRHRLYRCSAACCAGLACGQHLHVKELVKHETAQWQGALCCSWLSTRCHPSADAASTQEWKPALSRQCLSGVCSIRPFSMYHHASVWLFREDGLRPVLQGCR
jgi:hypothetical protein